jgi:alpha-L-fucosidase
VKPKQNEAYIEYFFTSKGSNLYCIVPRFTRQIRIHNLNIGPSTKATVLGNNKTFVCQRSGNACVIDLSQAKPGEIPGELFVVKLTGVVK